MRAFPDRAAAGRALGALLADTGRYGPTTVVLALPRGGVPVAAGVAASLHAELDVIVVRKLGTPRNPELAMGAIGSGGGLVLDDSLIEALGISTQQVQDVVISERAELERREAAYRAGRPPAELTDRDVVLVDDGIATGSSMRVAVEIVSAAGPASLTVAVPVAPPSTLADLRSSVDHVEAVGTPEPFVAVGVWYRDFTQTTDDEVRALLSSR